MGDEKLQVKISSDIEEMKKGMAESQQVFTTAIQQIVGQMNTMNAQVKTQTREMASSYVGAFQEIKSSLTGFFGWFGVSFGTYLSASFFKSAMSSVFDYRDSVASLARVMGTSSAEASVLNVALRMVGVSSETMTSAVMRLGMHVKTNESALNHLGVATRASNGEMLSQTTILNNALRTMQEYKAGTDRNMFSLYAFGRGASEVQRLLKLNDQVMQEARETANRFGLVIDDVSSNRIEGLHRQLRVMGVIWDALKIKLGSELIPEIARLSGVIQGLSSVLGPVMFLVRGVITLFEELRIIVSGVYSFLAASTNAYVQIWNASVNAMALIASGQFAEAGRTMASAIESAYLKMKAANQQAEVDAKTVRDRLISMWADVGKAQSGSTTESGTGKGTKSFVEPKGSGELFAEWKTQLLQMQMQENAFFGLGLEREKAFWASKLALIKGNGKEEIKLRQDVEKEIFELSRKSAQQHLSDIIASLKLQQADERTTAAERVAIQERIIGLMKQFKAQETDQYVQAVNERTKLMNAEEKDSEEFQTRRIEEEIRTNNAIYDERLKLTEFERKAWKISSDDALKTTKEIIEERYRAELEKLNSIAEIWKAYPKKWEEIQDRIAALSRKKAADITAAERSAVTDKADEQQRIENAIKAGDAIYQERLKEIEQARSLHEISARDEINQTRNTIRQRYEAELKLLQDIAEIWRAYPQEYEKVQERIRELERKKDADIKAAERKTTKDVAQEWEGRLSGITNAIGNAIQGMIEGTMKLRDAIRSIFSSVLSTIIGFFMQLLARWAATQIAMLIIGKTTETVSAVSRIAAEAAVAGAAAFASTCAIPIIGPELAPAVAATAYMSTMAFAPLALASAAGGWDVDRSSLAMIHEREMVLPANLAEGVRSMVGKGGGGSSQTVNFHIKSWDSRDMKSFVRKHGRQMVKNMGFGARNLGFRGAR